MGPLSLPVTAPRPPAGEWAEVCCGFLGTGALLPQVEGNNTGPAAKMRDSHSGRHMGTHSPREAEQIRSDRGYWQKEVSP